MEYRFDFDDALPDLPLAFDLDEVTQLFEQRLKPLLNPGGPPGMVRVVRLQDLKYQPSRRCVTTYVIAVEPPGEPAWQTIGVLEFLPEGVVSRLYSSDPLMPLDRAIDPENMRQHFSFLLDGQSEGVVALEEITPVRYKPGLHCVYRYRVRTPFGSRVFYGKMFARDEGPLMANISALHRESEATPAMPRIPQPLAYWPDLMMVVQPAVAQGVEFTKHVYNPSVDVGVRLEWMRRAGVTLAALHGCRVPGQLRTLQDDLHDLDEYTQAMTKVKPELAMRFRKTIEKIEAKIVSWAEPSPVPSHGAFRTDQFIIQEDRLAMIDLDGFCWSNPARDIGNFLAYLCWKAIRQPEHGGFVENAGRVFLDAYLEVRPDLDARWLAIFQAASLLKIAGRRFRNLNYLEWPLVIHLIEAAESTLKQDFSSLEAGSSEDWRGTLVAYLTTSTSLTKFPATFVDKEFPALWGALNAEMMTQDLKSILEEEACPDLTPAVRRVRLLAYKPGKRGVIRYDLGGMECHPGQAIFGKLYPLPEQSEHAYHVLKMLWDEVFCETPELGVPQPLGFIPQLSMLVFHPAEGQFLGEYIMDKRLDPEDANRIMGLAGAWLAALHTHRIPLEKQFNIASEYDNIHEWVELISRKYPEEGPAVEQIAAYLLKRAEQLEFENQVLIHKDFHYEHILVNHGLKVFDFDEIRLGDPNLDLAHFCANFYLLAYRNNKHTAHFSDLQNQFFEAYSRITGWEMGECFLFFYAYTCLKIAKQLCKKRGPRPWPEGEEQHAQVWLMLEQGLTTVAQAIATQKSPQKSLPTVEFSRIRRLGWMKAGRISKSGTSSEAIHVSHKLLL